MPALTESEARARAALLAIDSYDVSIDLTATPVRSRTAIRFRCARPGAASFADLTAQVRGGAAVLNGAPLGPVGRRPPGPGRAGGRERAHRRGRGFRPEPEPVRRAVGRRGLRARVRVPDRRARPVLLL